MSFGPVDYEGTPPNSPVHQAEDQVAVSNSGDVRSQGNVWSTSREGSDEKVSVLAKERFSEESLEKQGESSKDPDKLKTKRKHASLGDSEVGQKQLLEDKEVKKVQKIRDNAFPEEKEEEVSQKISTTSQIERQVEDKGKVKAKELSVPSIKLPALKLTQIPEVNLRKASEDFRKNGYEVSDRFLQSLVGLEINYPQSVGSSKKIKNSRQIREGLNYLQRVAQSAGKSKPFSELVARLNLREKIRLSSIQGNDKYEAVRQETAKDALLFSIGAEDPYEFAEKYEYYQVSSLDELKSRDIQENYISDTAIAKELTGMTPVKNGEIDISQLKMASPSGLAYHTRKHLRNDIWLSTPSNQGVKKIFDEAFRRIDFQPGHQDPKSHMEVYQSLARCVIEKGTLDKNCPSIDQAGLRQLRWTIPTNGGKTIQVIVKITADDQAFIATFY